MIIQIDTTVEKPWALRRVAQFILAHADAVEAMTTGVDPVIATMIRDDKPLPTPAVPGTKLREVFGHANPTARSGADVASIPIVPGVQSTIPALSIPPLPNVVPPVPSESPAPAVATPAPAPVANVEFDAYGMPYDLRIHNSGRTKKIDGSWKLQKGIDKSYAASIEAELREKYNLSAPAQPPAVPEVPAVPPIPSIPAPAQPTLTPNGMMPATGFGELMDLIGRAVPAGLVTQAEVNQTCHAFGVPNLIMLQTKPELIPQVKMGIESVIASRQPA